MTPCALDDIDEENETITTPSVSVLRNTAIGYSVAFVFMSALCFSTAFWRTGGFANVFLFLGWVSVAFGIYTVAVYLDFKRANPD